MVERIKALAEYTVKGEMFPTTNEPNYQKGDEFLPHIVKTSKRAVEYILNQEPVLRDESCFTGLIKFSGKNDGEIFSRQGHTNFRILLRDFYNNPVDNLVTFEWQHTTAEFERIIKIGLKGILEEIENSIIVHKEEPEKVRFLECEKTVVLGILKWAEKCSQRARQRAEKVTNPEYKQNLLKLSKAFEKVPYEPATSFYEAILSLYFLFSYVPDSIGLADRYLYPYYIKDKKDGILTDEKAKEYLQELFLMLQSRISIKSDRFYRGGESHFCIGGYNEKGEDVFNELSLLMLDSLMELPTWIPQISFRWTKKTKRETFRHIMDCERKDKNKRIAFVNDEPRIEGLMKYSGFSYEQAVSYSMIGCNEIALPGGIVLGWDMTNVARSLENTFIRRKEEIIKAESFDEFYKIYKEELFKDLNEAEAIKEKMQEIRSKDCNIVSSPFMNGCTKNGKSITQGGCENYIAVASLIGITTVIDSITIVKQFVFDEKKVSMSELVEALNKNWEGYEELRNSILKNGKFFGNDYELSNEISVLFSKTLDEWNTGKNYLNRKYIFGNLIGYNEHNKIFGDNLTATPDGRYKGDMISFGLGQSEGKDKEGVTSLLNSIAKCDPCKILTGSSVTNVWIENDLMMKDENFEKTVTVFETYFKNGGTHFQLNYSDVNEMKDALINPEKHKSLRVRVSGFSDYFNFLNENLQNEVIKRTTHGC